MKYMFLLMGLFLPIWIHAVTLEVSRAPSEGCSWREFENQELGVRLSYEDCNDPAARYVLSVRDNWIERHRPADDRTFSGPRVLQVFTKPAKQKIEVAIMQNFVKKLEGEAKKGCRVVRMKKSPVNGPGKVVLQIVPTGRYEKKILKELQNEPRDFGCGPYGKDQALTYFEYHPNESKTKYAFVVYGWSSEHPLFDENSIVFIKK